MTTRAYRVRQAVRIALLLGTASVASLASQSPTLIYGAKTLSCYCNCEKVSGAPKCIKMCELPQYENRWWAVSCHKKAPNRMQPAAPPSNSGSRKTNRKEIASL